MSVRMWLRYLMLPLPKIDTALPRTGNIYEIGCGKGIIASYVSLGSQERQVTGIDTDQKKIKLSQLEHTQPNLKFKLADALNFTYPRLDGVVMSDFLHHIDYKLQEKLLKILSSKMEKGAIIVIKEVDAKDGMLTWCSRFWDFIFYPHDSIYYRTKSEWVHLLSTLGYRVKVSREVHWFPGSTHLFICEKNQN